MVRRGELARVAGGGRRGARLLLGAGEVEALAERRAAAARPAPPNMAIVPWPSSLGRSRLDLLADNP